MSRESSSWERLGISTSGHENILRAEAEKGKDYSLSLQDDYSVDTGKLTGGHSMYVAGGIDVNQMLMLLLDVVAAVGGKKRCKIEDTRGWTGINIDCWSSPSILLMIACLGWHCREGKMRIATASPRPHPRRRSSPPGRGGT